MNVFQSTPLACFRKSFNLTVDAEAKVEISADDTYELFINGRRVGTGKSSRQLDAYNIAPFLIKGKNTVGVRVVNTMGNTAAVAVRVLVKPTGGKWFSFNSDPSWKTFTGNQPQWQTPVFNDRSWKPAQAFGALGNTVPWDRSENVASKTEHQSSERFQIQPGFSVQRVMDNEEVGSLIAMTINEFGHIIASQEGGPLLLIYDSDKDGVPDAVRTYCEEVTSCQGLLALNGEVFANGFGKEGPGLYRLQDNDRNGTMETVKLLLKYAGTPGEHGAHGLTLGPDGMLYIVLGNHIKVDAPYAKSSSLKTWYEGDIVPRYEDPGGHARGIKAPGGVIVRTDLEGKNVELVAGGLRNAYDMVFHPDGGAFIHDSDMESDVGAAWYQPTVLFDVVEGGEYGWRSGWSIWPKYYPDRLPAVLETGRGSPTGAVVYEHYMFPAHYQNAMFLADWSEGRILSVHLTGQGATTQVNSEVFLQGKPLNVTDLGVAADGSLYFCTGGRGTAGGIYRVLADGDHSERAKNLGTGIAKAIRQPQLDAAWSRQEIAIIKKELGDSWNELVAGVAISNENPDYYRLRALDLMQLYGPEPTQEFLLDLSRSSSEPVRGRAAKLMAIHGNERTETRLGEMLADKSSLVQRAACEALVRSNGKIPPTKVLPLLNSDDRYLSFSARRVLEGQPVEKWRSLVLSSEDPRVRILGSLALMNAEPKHDTAMQVLEAMSQTMRTDIDDKDFTTLLRTMEVAIHRGKIKPEEIVPLREQVAEEFPAGNPHMCRELIRLATFLQADSVVPRAMEYLQSDASQEDRVFVAMHLQFMNRNWTAAQRFELLKFYEQAAQVESGSSVPLYLMNVTRDFAKKNLTEQEAAIILAEGERWPNAALGALYKVKMPMSEETAIHLRELDQKITGDEFYQDVYRRLRTGIVALLAVAEDEESQSYLRKVWRTDPERRQPVAMALAQNPKGDNWDYLVRSLHVLQGDASTDVLTRLAAVDIATDDPDALREVILIGLRNLEENGSPDAAQKLLKHWTGLKMSEQPEEAMQKWVAWYSENYPDRPAATLPKMGEDSQWDFDQVLEYISSKDGQLGDPNAGEAVYAKAQCIACHRLGTTGTTVGPDLTSVAKRFSKRETLESVLYPSHMISDQYRSRRVLTHSGKVYTGIVSDGVDGSVTIRDSRNETVTLAQSEIDQILPSNSSIMPSGLLDNFSLKDISDLFAYMGVIPPLEVAERDAVKR
jgi:putative heme-binding domain-containing protein